MFDNQDKLNVGYQETTDEIRSLLDSNIISLFLRPSLYKLHISPENVRQLILFCRLKICSQATDNELGEFLRINQLTDEVKNEVEFCLQLHISDKDYATIAPDIPVESRKAQYEQDVKKDYFINNAISKVALAQIYKKYKYQNIDSVKKYFITVGDIILGFYKIEDTVPLLQQELELDAKTAALLGADILDFLAPLSDPNWQPPVDDFETDNVPGSEERSLSPQPNVSYETRIDSVQPETELPQLRTMAGDMLEERSPVRSTFNPVTTLDEPMYQSSQPVIAKKAPDAPSYNAPLYQPPKPNVDAPLEKPRWS
jgi:hypothetical protein